MMNNQKREEELYTALGQYLVDILAYNNVKDWDKVYLTVRMNLNLIFSNIDCMKGDTIKSLEVGNSVGVDDYKTIKELKKFTDANNYTPWNKFTFELTPNYQFNIKYSWDKEFEDEWGR